MTERLSLSANMRYILGLDHGDHGGPWCLAEKLELWQLRLDSELREGSKKKKKKKTSDLYFSKVIEVVLCVSVGTRLETWYSQGKNQDSSEPQWGSWSWSCGVLPQESWEAEWYNLLSPDVLCPRSRVLIEWKSLSRVPTLCNPMDYTVHGILQTRILEWVTFPFSRGSSQPRDGTQVSHIAGRFFTSWATREAQEYWSG